MHRRRASFTVPVPLPLLGLAFALLVVLALGLGSSLQTQRASADSSLEAESMSLPSSQGQVFSDRTASGGKGILIWSNGTASTSFSTTDGVQGISIRARGDQ